MLPHAAIERRHDSRVAEVDLGDLEVRVGLVDRGRAASRCARQLSTCDWEVAFCLARRSWRSYSEVACVSVACCCSTVAFASCTLARYGSGSITNSRSPFLTMEPSWKFTDWR
jgi:hypothetical protein